jgi:hypothetical protein
MLLIYIHMKFSRKKKKTLNINLSICVEYFIFGFLDRKYDSIVIILVSFLFKILYDILIL